MDGFWGLMEGLTQGFPTWFRGFLVVFLPVLVILTPLLPSILREVRLWRHEAHERAVMLQFVRRRLEASLPEKNGVKKPKNDVKEE